MIKIDTYISIYILSIHIILKNDTEHNKYFSCITLYFCGRAGVVQLNPKCFRQNSN